tara:strand:+ start:701 stop:1138 length:438 start_codon:yes stop_codon:yes gene_type:complete
MNNFNELSFNLQEIILKKIFKTNNKSLLLNELNSIISEYNKSKTAINVTFYKYLFYEQISLLGDKCDYCKSHANDRGFFQFFDDYPFYEKTLIKNNTYKFKKKFKNYWMNYINSSSYRCSFDYNYLCYGCYFGYSKKSCKFFIYL